MKLAENVALQNANLASEKIIFFYIISAEMVLVGRVHDKVKAVERYGRDAQR